MHPVRSASSEFTITEIANAYGISLRTMRFYESRGLLHPYRVGTQRIYTAKDRTRLELILKGKRLGFTLLEIERLLAELPAAKSDSDEPAGLPLDRAQFGQRLQVLEQKRDALDGVIRELNEALAAKG